MNKIENPVIVITGSSKGIGYAIASACAQKGAKIIISSRNQESVKEAVKELTGMGYEVSGFAADVSNFESIKGLLDFAIQTYGRIDVWISNAGVSEGYRNYSELSKQEIDMVLDINLKGLMYCANIVLPYFEKEGKGRLFNMLGRGSDGRAVKHMPIYSATKAAVSSFTKSLAAEYKDKNVQVNSIMPGMVDTELIKNTKVSPGLEKDMKVMPYVLQAFGNPIEEVGEFIADVVFNKSIGKTGKTYSILKGFKLFRGIVLMGWWGMSGKL